MTRVKPVIIKFMQHRITSIVALRLTHILLQEQLKLRDQSLRKQEQEMDSLSFRNQQLAKRVELLQEELAVSEAKGKKGKVIMKVDRGRGCSRGPVIGSCIFEQ